MMTNKRNTEKTDAAWSRLYNRFEKDGLLMGEETRKRKSLPLPAVYKWGAVAAVACLCLIVGIVISEKNADKAVRFTLENNDNSLNLVTTLDDGSVVYLAGQSSLDYPKHFDENKREVALRGEAFFDISENEGKPFIIETESALVEILGTAFNVRSGGDVPFSLSVLRGKVRVTDKAMRQSILVGAGQNVLLDQRGLQLSEITDMGLFDAYTGNVHFKSEKLADIVSVINSNSEKEKIVLSPGLESRLLTVSFRSETPFSMARLISMALNLQYSQDGDVITLYE